jgi:hypothetical protein
VAKLGGHCERSAAIPCPAEIASVDFRQPRNDRTIANVVRPFRVVPRLHEAKAVHYMKTLGVMEKGGGLEPPPLWEFGIRWVY